MTAPKTGHRPAFPDDESTGLSRREYIAAQVMAGYMTEDGPGIEASASVAVRAADALLAELEQTKGDTAQQPTGGKTNDQF